MNIGGVGWLSGLATDFQLAERCNNLSLSVLWYRWRTLKVKSGDKVRPSTMTVHRISSWAGLIALAGGSIRNAQMFACPNPSASGKSQYFRYCRYVFMKWWRMNSFKFEDYNLVSNLTYSDICGFRPVQKEQRQLLMVRISDELHQRLFLILASQLSWFTSNVWCLCFKATYIGISVR